LREGPWILESDKELIRRVVGQDSDAFDTLMLRHEQLVRRHLLRMLRDDSVAEDLTQEVFLQLWRKSDQWTGEGSLKAWLVRIATNLALNYFRSVRRRRERPLETSQPAGQDDDESLVPSWMIDASTLGPDEVFELAEQREILAGLLNGLSEDKREMLRMVHNDQMNYAEVAQAMGIPLGTVKSRMHYTMKQLYAQWQRSDEQQENA